MQRTQKNRRVDMAVVRHCYSGLPVFSDQDRRGKVGLYRQLFNKGIFKRCGKIDVFALRRTVKP